MTVSKTLRRSLVLVAVAIVVILAGAQLRTSLGIDLDVDSVRTFAEGLGALGPLLFVGVVALRSLLALPSQVVLIAAGLCFGTLLGTVIGGTGLMLSGTGIFLGVRYAGRNQIEQRKTTRFGRFLEASGHRAGAIALAIGSGYPISPLSPIHGAAGLTPMSLGLFMFAALCGGLIRASIFSYFGNALTTTNRSAFIVSGLVLFAILALPLCFAKGRAWLAILFGIERSESLATSSTETVAEED